MSAEELAELIRRTLCRTPAVEVDGLGVFTRDDSGHISFRSGKRPRVFIAYASEDAALAERLFNDLHWRGFAPWMDRRKLLPGQNWPRRIEEAIANSDFFVGCFSRHSVKKRGGFQAEVRYALDCARRVPLDDVFLIPARFDDCRVPVRIQRETHYVDLFPDWNSGLARIVAIIDYQVKLAGGDKAA
jgi:TIR domain-containing protein